MVILRRSFFRTHKPTKFLQKRKNVRERVEFGTYVCVIINSETICSEEQIENEHKHNTNNDAIICFAKMKGDRNMGIFGLAFALLPLLAVNEMRRNGSYVSERRKKRGR